MKVGSNKGVLISAKLFSAANGGSLCMLLGVDIVRVRPTFTGQCIFILCLSQQSWGIIYFKGN